MKKQETTTNVIQPLALIRFALLCFTFIPSSRPPSVCPGPGPSKDPRHLGLIHRYLPPGLSPPHALLDAAPRQRRRQRRGRGRR